MASSSSAAHRISTAMERTGRWVFSQEVPSDIVIKVDDATFPLHKFILVAKSGYIRKKIIESDKSDLATLELKGIPGGADAFEKAARFCYGVNFEISVENVAALRCATEWLEMTEKSCEGNLAARADEFIAKAALITLPGAVALLKSCEKLLPFADKLRIVQRCVDAIGSKATQEANSPSRSPPDWWAAELAILSPPVFQKPLAAMKARGAAPKTLSTAVAVYAGKSLPDLLPLFTSCGRSPSVAAPSASTDRSAQRNFIESFIAILPTDQDAPLPVGFLCCFLRAAIFLNASAASRRDLERRIAPSLDQVAVGDLMAIAFDLSGQRLADLDSIRRIVTGFAEREVAGAAAQRAARVVDAFVAEIATEEDLPVSKFVGIAGALPKSLRRFDDDLYRAVDIYLKAHSGLDEIEREKACSVMDPLRLSYEARLHASQNKRLPVQVVLHALYYDQLKLRSTAADEPPVVAVGRGDESLAKENEALRSELARMKLYLTDIQRNQGSNSGKSAAVTALPAPPAAAKKTTFFTSMSKKLGKLNPFRQGSKDTSAIEGNGGVDLAKPRRRRFSIS
ncbi:root phototropism protein 2 [Phalaenopsis equestris]|uniref:root phototropism protein 2 n=1 Tax=Phalaenopsis equestris TaxID=78828 RepID=UPI0009E549CC|nr:root phototropism protein 2 [Phalaenopsis equestris]